MNEQVSGSTCFFSLQYLSQCDIVLYMKNGKIAERGTYDELLRNNGVKTSTMNYLGLKTSRLKKIPLPICIYPQFSVVIFTS